MSKPFTVDCGSLLPLYASQPAGGQDMMRPSPAEFRQRDSATIKPRPRTLTPAGWLGNSGSRLPQSTALRAPIYDALATPSFFS
jgi:hypothetical protein